MFRFLSFLFLALPLNQALASGWGKSGGKKRRGWVFLDGPIMARFLDGMDTGHISIILRIFSAMAVITVLEIRRPGGDERRGVLGLTTTRGDRLFISLLGAAYIFLAWLGLMGQPLWWPVAISIGWMVFCFWKV